jgi:hypothetical protein
VISEFVGGRPQYKKAMKYYKNEIQYQMSPDYTGLKYHSDWNWLMGAIHIVDEMREDRVSHKYGVEIDGNGTTISQSSYTQGNRLFVRRNSHNNRLFNTFNALVEFIETFEKYETDE